jgi:hypothetical protein
MIEANVIEFYVYTNESKHSRNREKPLYMHVFIELT